MRRKLLKLEQKERHVDGIIRQSIWKISLMLGENIIELRLGGIDMYLETLSRRDRHIDRGRGVPKLFQKSEYQIAVQSSSRLEYYKFH